MNWGEDGNWDNGWGEVVRNWNELGGRMEIGITGVLRNWNELGGGWKLG